MNVVPIGCRPLALVGATASGKSALAMALARTRGDIELVSVDSMQVYRGMDIGTAKPSTAERAEVRHHLIDVVDPWDAFEVHSFQRCVADVLADIRARSKHPLLVGGTGLYLRAVVDGLELPGRFPTVAGELEATPDTPEGTARLYGRLAVADPVAAARMEPTNRRRVIRALEVTLGSGRRFSSFGPGLDAYPPTPVRLVGIRLPPDVIAERIEARYHQQMADGLLDEVNLLAAGPPLSRTAAQALGYRELLAHVCADPSAGPTLDETLDEAIRRTRRFAKRQRAWFGRDPRVTWLDADHDALVTLPALAAIASDCWD
ncbi:MAG: tRNA (adenosine(37)-N6)-dimethylallyltransferase MiaA [Acidimicrobiales bacterium]